MTSGLRAISFACKHFHHEGTPFFPLDDNSGPTCKPSQLVSPLTPGVAATTTASRTRAIVASASSWTLRTFRA